MTEHVDLPLDIERAAANPEAMEVPVCISSEAVLYQSELKRNVKLSHDPIAVDLARAKKHGIPVRTMHQRGLPIARVFDPRIDNDRKLRGTMRFSRSDEGRARYQDVMDSIISDLSVGAQITQHRDDDGIIVATRWVPTEVSMVDVGLDPAAGVARNSNGDTKMTENSGQTTESTGGQPAAVLDVTTLKRDYKRAKADGAKEAILLERQRLADLDDLFTMAIVPDNDFYRALRIQAIDSGWSVDESRKVLLEAMSGEAVPATDHSSITDRGMGMSHVSRQHRSIPSNEPRQMAATAGVDEFDKFKAIATESILVRSGVVSDKDTIKRVSESGYREYSLLRFGQEYLAMKGHSLRGVDDKSIARMMLERTSGPHTTADFASIMANVANLSAQRGWTEAPVTWNRWCNTGSLSDFKQATIAGLGAYPNLDKIPRAGGPYKHHSMDDVHETAQLATYGALFGISREAIISDSLDQLARTPQALGAAAARTVNALAYAVITGNQTMTETGAALFNATAIASGGHANLETSGGAPTVARLDAGFLAMSLQKAPARSGETNSAYLNIEPAYLIVPRALKATADTLVSAMYDPAGTAGTLTPNRYQNRLEVVADATLDGGGYTVQWYLAAPKNGTVDTVTMFFLNGVQEPYIEEISNGPSDGVTYKVRIDAVARAIDWRGMYQNDGA